jgi:putative transposase
MKELAEVPEADREHALARFRLLEPHLLQGKELRSVAGASGVSFRTLQRWVAQYRKDGLLAFVRRSRVDRGVPRIVSPAMKFAIEGLALENPPLPISSIYRQIRQFAVQIGEPLPSYGTVYALVRSLPADLLTLAHRGSRAYSEVYDLVHRREASRPNAIWQVDHAQLPIRLTREDGGTARPWLTIVIDDFSRAIAGYYLAFDPPSSLRTCLALRQAIWRKQDPHWQVCGIPEVLYTDNGSDFTSKRLEQVAIALRIKAVFSTPGEPRGRGRVERFFRTVNEMFLADLNGYTRRGRQKASYSLVQLDGLFRTFLLTAYHLRSPSEGRLPPAKRWEDGAFLPRMPDSLEQLDLLLMEEVRSRRVRQDGVHFHKLRYVSLTLAAYVGEEVNIRFDPRDMGEIRVFHRNKFLCRAISAELAGEEVPLREIIRVRNQRRRTLRGVLQDRRDAVDTLLELRRGEVRAAIPKEDHGSRAAADRPRIKRYRNE